MPQLNQAKKALKASQHKRAANDRWRKRIHDTIHAVTKAIQANNKEAAQTAYTRAQVTIDRATRRNIIHPNKANRKKSRLSQAIKKIN